jgi:uncharacterized RDD family membrane protein YckC
MTKVGFWWRVLAVLIDACFLLLILLLLSIMWPSLYQLGLTVNEMNALSIGIAVLYLTTEVFFAGTPGKLILRQRIKTADGTVANTWRLLTRWCGKQYPIIFNFLFITTAWFPFHFIYGFGICVVLFGCLFAANEDKRAWHDQWAGTAVFWKERVEARGFPVTMRNE